MKLSGNCYLKNKRDKLDYLIEFTHLNGEQVSYLKEIGRKGKPVKINIEIEESILADDEKEFLETVIRPFRNRIISIQKRDWNMQYECLHFYVIGEPTSACIIFANETVYKGMKLYREYSLQELEL